MTTFKMDNFQKREIVKFSRSLSGNVQMLSIFPVLLAVNHFEMEMLTRHMVQNFNMTCGQIAIDRSQSGLRVSVEVAELKQDEIQIQIFKFNK